VQSRLNQPESAIAEEVKSQARQSHPQEWMRDVQATFSINEGSTSVDENGNIYFPRYNLAWGLISSISPAKGQKRRGKHDIKIAQHKVNQRKLEIAPNLTLRASNSKNSLKPHPRSRRPTPTIAYPVVV
jgi:hypothetical protein